MHFKGDVNFAHLRPATQSSTRDQHVASNAVDGIVDKDHKAMTDNDDNHPWWMVKLAHPIWVNQVEIHGVTSE